MDHSLLLFWPSFNSRFGPRGSGWVPRRQTSVDTGWNARGLVLEKLGRWADEARIPTRG